jgi:ribosomal protein S18 acetylase RimI-like enzyme
MGTTITYRHWQPGDDDAVLELFLQDKQFGITRDYYEKKFDGYLEPEGVRLALVGERVVGHVFGSQTYLFIEGRSQDFGMVTVMYVAPDMRRQGIATRLMQDLNAYFEKKGYRGISLHVETAEAYRLYWKVGYQEVTRELQTQLSPHPNSSLLKWTEVNPEEFDILHQIKKRWASQNFPVYWNGQYPEVHQYNIKQYRALRRKAHIVGYAKWDEPSEHRPQGLIWDPMVPDEDPMEVITSVQAAIPALRVWQTAEGSRYEYPLRALGYTLQPTEWVDMLLPIGPGIDWTKLARTFW